MLHGDDPQLGDELGGGLKPLALLQQGHPQDREHGPNPRDGQQVVPILAERGIRIDGVINQGNKDRYKYCFHQIWLFNGNLCSL